MAAGGPRSEGHITDELSGTIPQHLSKRSDKLRRTLSRAQAEWGHLTPLDIRPEAVVMLGRMSTRDTDHQLELMQGTLDLLILQTVAFGRVHGHAIARSIERRSGEALQVGHGSLYPALQRLLKLGLITAEDGISENNRKARFYRLTAKGRKQLSTEASRWQKFSSAIALILAPVAEENP